MYVCTYVCMLISVMIFIIKKILCCLRSLRYIVFKRYLIVHVDISCQSSHDLTRCHMIHVRTCMHEYMCISRASPHILLMTSLTLCICGVCLCAYKCVHSSHDLTRCIHVRTCMHEYMWIGWEWRGHS